MKPKFLLTVLVCFVVGALAAGRQWLPLVIMTSAYHGWNWWKKQQREKIPRLPEPPQS